MNPPGRASLAWAWPPGLVAARRRLQVRISGQRTLGVFVLSLAAVNVTSLLGQALAFRFVEPEAMGVWHALLLASTYLAILRLGLVNGMGRELPFALGAHDLLLARRIAATSLAWNIVCSAVAGLVFLAAGPFVHAGDPAWRIALPCMAVVSASTFYLAYLQATFRSDADFERLSRVQWLQAAIAVLMPFMVHAFGFAGLAVHAAVQATVVTSYAHSLRPLRVAPRFEPGLARRLLATGLPLFLSGYLQTLAVGFDRVILLHRGAIATLGYYAPAVAVLSAMAIMPGAVSSYVYPRMSYALGQGRADGEVRRMALQAAALSMAVGVPVALVGWLAAPSVIAHYFPRYVASIPAVRWSLVSGLLWSVSPAAQVLGSLKAWLRLAAYIALLLVTRWTFPWVFSALYEPIEGVALGNLWAAAVTGVVSLLLVRGACSPAARAAAA